MGVRNALKTLFLLLFLPFFVIACSSNKQVRKPPPFRVVKTTLAKGIDDKGTAGIPLNPTTTFSTEDSEIISHVKLRNLSGKHALRWEWYDSQGNLYYATKDYPIMTSKGKYAEDTTAWHKISLRGERAQKYPGDWKVNIYLDHALIASKAFEIKPEQSGYATPPGLPPMLSIEEISFSENVLDAGETAELKITLKNTGVGIANDAYLELSSPVKDLSFEPKKPLPTMAAKGGSETVRIPITAGMQLQTGEAYLDLQVIEPHFRVKIKGKRLAFQTRKFRNPELILAKFAALESESPAKNDQIDINEIVDLRFVVQNVGQGTAEDVKVEVINNQAGVMFLGVGKGERLVRQSPQFERIDIGKHNIINYRYFVNSDFGEKQLKFTIEASEKHGEFGFSETKLLAINTELKPEGYIRKVSVNEDTIAEGYTIEDIPDLKVDVDVNIPRTNMQNRDAIAVVIGNRNYEHKDVPPVLYARRDAETVKQYLLKTLGYKEGNVILECDATKAKFEALFGISGNHRGKLHDYIKPNKSDVFIYYSGHGAPDPNTKKGYFVPVNCDPSKVALNGYSLDIFYENLSRLDARKITVVVDACFSGGTSSGGSLISSASPTLIAVSNPAIAKGNTTCLTSSKGDQISSWYNEKQHGLFTYFFLKAIGGSADMNADKLVTFQEIYDYVSDRSEGVPYWARRLHSGRLQTPTMLGRNNEEVLVRY